MRRSSKRKYRQTIDWAAHSLSYIVNGPWLELELLYLDARRVREQSRRRRQHTSVAAMARRKHSVLACSSFLLCLYLHVYMRLHGASMWICECALCTHFSSLPSAIFDNYFRNRTVYAFRVIKSLFRSSLLMNVLMKNTSAGALSTSTETGISTCSLAFGLITRRIAKWTQWVGGCSICTSPRERVETL
jgi:hypothetical protein